MEFLKRYDWQLKEVVTQTLGEDVYTSYNHGNLPDYELNDLLSEWFESIQDTLKYPKESGKHTIKRDHESAQACYTFDVDEDMTDKAFQDWLYENYKIDCTSSYDCSGQWFTSSIYFNRIDDTVYTVLINSACDI